MGKKEKLRVITTKLGLDSHVIGIKLVSQALREAGCEVIYLGLFQTPDMVVSSAFQEDADVICISSLASNSKQIIEVVNLLRERNRPDIPVIAGGTIPLQDALKLKKAGVREVFPPGSSLDSIAKYITSLEKSDPVAK